MRKILVISMISLDGVIQAPGGPEEDPSAGFKFGGWVAPYGDKVSGEEVQRQLQQPADYILGRKTFDIWVNFWPHHGDFWPRINEGAKYVLSNTLKNSDPIVTGWKNTLVIENVEDIKKLKNSEGADIQVWGSSKLVQLLLKNDLVDELCLKIYPIILGDGKKLFKNGEMPIAFTLTDTLVTTTGVIIANYKRAGEVKTGTIGA